MYRIYRSHNHTQRKSISGLINSARQSASSKTIPQVNKNADYGRRRWPLPTELEIRLHSPIAKKHPYQRTEPEHMMFRSVPVEFKSEAALARAGGTGGKSSGRRIAISTLDRITTGASRAFRGNCGVKRRPSTAVSLCLLAALIAGCSKDEAGVGAAASGSTDSSAATAPASDHDAIVAAVEEHLRGNAGIKMSVMEMNVTSVSIKGDQAQANTEFRLKQGGASMKITYTLERHGTHWMVLSNQPDGGQFVHPPMDQNHSGAASNPTGPLPDATEFLKNQAPAARQ